MKIFAILKMFAIFVQTKHTKYGKIKNNYKSAQRDSRRQIS